MDARSAAIRAAATAEEFTVPGRAEIAASTISGNSTEPGPVGGSGGGIYLSGRAIIKDCAVIDNQSGAGTPASRQLGDGFHNALFGGDGGQAGGIFNNGTLLMYRCSVVGNRAGDGGRGQDAFFQLVSAGGGGRGGDGGGMLSWGPMRIAFSTISGNSAGSGGDGGFAGERNWPGTGGLGGCGGGIVNYAPLAIVASTISENSAGAGGNGAANAPAMGGRFNSASGGFGGSGGGILSVGSLRLGSCTIAHNRAGRGGNAGTGNEFASATELHFYPGGWGGSGGGIYMGSPIFLANTLIALNSPGVGGDGGTNIFDQVCGPSGTDGLAADVRSGRLRSYGYNLVGEADGSGGLTNAVGGDLCGSQAAPIDPLRSPTG